MTNRINRITTTELAAYYGVSVHLLTAWRKTPGFPDDAVTRNGQSLDWDLGKVNEWLCSRPIDKRRPVRWAKKCGHPHAHLLDD